MVGKQEFKNNQHRRSSRIYDPFTYFQSEIVVEAICIIKVHELWLQVHELG